MTAPGEATARGTERHSVEAVAQFVIMLVIGCAAGAGSFRHVHDVAAAHGQDGWLAWTDAVVLELMSVASGLELRRRKRTHTATGVPAAALGLAVTLSLGAQVVQAERSVLGWIAAAIPALGFLVMVKIAMAHGDGQAAVVDQRDPVAPSQPPAGSRGVGQETRDDVVEGLMPVARVAAESLAAAGQPLSRQALAGLLRAEGYPASTARLSEVLRRLRAEGHEHRPLRRAGSPGPSGAENPNDAAVRRSRRVPSRVAGRAG